MSIVMQDDKRFIEFIIALGVCWRPVIEDCCVLRFDLSFAWNASTSTFKAEYMNL